MLGVWGRSAWLVSRSVSPNYSWYSVPATYGPLPSDAEIKSILGKFKPQKQLSGPGSDISNVIFALAKKK